MSDHLVGEGAWGDFLMMEETGGDCRQLRRFLIICSAAAKSGNDHGSTSRRTPSYKSGGHSVSCRPETGQSCAPTHRQATTATRTPALHCCSYHFLRAKVISAMIHPSYAQAGPNMDPIQVGRVRACLLPNKNRRIVTENGRSSLGIYFGIHKQSHNHFDTGGGRA